MKRATLLGLLLAAQPSTAAAQHDPTFLDSYRKAVQLIEQAVNAHGGVEALRAARHIRVVTEGHEYHRTQGAWIAAPYDSTPRRNDVMIDLTKSRIVSEQSRAWPGGFFYTTRFVTNGDRFYNVAPRNRNYSEQQGWDPAERQFGNLFAVPSWYLLAAHENTSPGARRYLGRMRLGSSGPTVDAIHFTIPPSGNIVIGLDPETHMLRGVLSVSPDVFTGDTDVYTEFRDWRMLGGMLLPTESLLVRAGDVSQRLRFTHATLNFAIPDSLLTPGPGYAPAPANPPAQPVRELAPGVWLVGGGSQSLVVAFNDHLVAVDAPSNGSADVIARMRTLAPGKPIRYAIPTHHHDDHMFGARYHANAGATIVTTPGNADYLRRMMHAPMSTLMLAANQVPPQPSYRSEIMTGAERVFTDGRTRLEIHRIESQHAREMLIAWLPEHGILYHADLIEAPQAGVALRGANAETTLHLAQLIREKGWNVKVFAGAHATLQSPAVFDELVKLPIVPLLPR